MRASPVLERELRDTNVAGSIIWTLLAIGIRARRHSPEAISAGLQPNGGMARLKRSRTNSRQPPLAAPNSCRGDATRARNSRQDAEFAEKARRLERPYDRLRADPHPSAATARAGSATARLSWPGQVSGHRVSPIPREAPAGRLPLRGGPLRDHGAVPLGGLLPLHPLPAPNGHRLLGQRPRPPGRIPPAGGSDRLRAFKPPTGVPKLFCGDVRLGAVQRRTARGIPRSRCASARSTAIPGSAPRYRQFTASAAPWEPIPDDGLERHPGTRS